MESSGIDSAALDRWITGNYGEDRFKGVCQWEECPCYEDCPCDHDERECHEDKRADGAEDDSK